ncbi:uncharacterized protein LMH87_007645 [Akanthomyces muscarius]|uniref:NACHT domain-containing protein n=1 Tax=Akanthomyces muscarius TaxID=2231603 RepID=A0A9W8QMJ8_AKAMU|nr:uncharacterized protein LMH87_007645 [Akanthomyces muscarius]KAJ4161615.1 hypothetical protein LMH87_007645 [Akanthomyces muscarius]
MSAATYAKDLITEILPNQLEREVGIGKLLDKIALQQEDHIESRVVKDKDNEILNWLTPMPIDHGLQYSDLLKVREPGTGQWLLDSAQYQTWMDMQKQTLFCPGNPGVGKTILTSIVVEDLFSRFGNVQKVGIAYLYCSFQRQSEQKTDNLLASLLRQLAQALPSLPGSVKSLYKSHNNKRTRPSFHEISNTLQTVATMYSRVFIVVDALDECQESDGGRTKLLSEISSLQAKCGVNVFATSRLIPDIIQQMSEKFDGTKTLNIGASDEDVGRYLDGVMSELPKFVGREPDLQREIKTKIMKAIGGTFLLAKLHIDTLKGKRTPMAIRKALTELAELATGSDAYDRVYNNAMKRIEGQLKGQTKLAMQVLSWIVNAKRPLTTSELQHALAVEIDETKLDKDNFPDIEDMVSVCAGLVTADEESGIIRLVHYTTQEYFERTQKSWFPNAQDHITKVCITYLSFRVFESGFCQTDTEFEERLQVNQLYDYAAHNWGHHARQASTLGQEVLDFLRGEANVEASSQAMMAPEYRYRGYSQHFPRHMTGVHLAAYFGLKEVAQALLWLRHGTDMTDSYGRTPLSYGAENGYEAVVKSLIATEGVEPDLKDNDGRSPLSWAAERGHNVAVELLLVSDNVKPDSKDDHGRTPLSRAAQEGHEAVVKLLLQNKARPDSKDKFSQTPLWWAARYGHGGVVKLLLAEDAVNPDIKDIHYNGTPLWWAAQEGHVAVVKLLLDTDRVDLDSKNTYGQTPLSRAAQMGREAVVELLLARAGVNWNSKDTLPGRTALSYAAGNGHKAAIKLLLEKEVEPDSKDLQHERTPLSWAAENGHTEVVDLLLSGDGVNSVSRDRYSRTPLSRAAENGHEGVVKLLLAENIVDSGSKDTLFGRTPLSWAAENGHEEVVKLLLATGVFDPDLRDKHGQTPLSLAAENGHETVVKLLLEMEVELDSKDAEHNQTPLLWTAMNGHEAVVRLLLEKDAEPDSKNKNGRTPLSWAAGNGHEAIVRLLLGTGIANAGSKDTWSRTPLSYAAGNGHETIIRLLLNKDQVDADSKDTGSRTPLSYAAGNGHETIVRLLLDTDQVDADSKDNGSRTPLSYAAGNGRKDIVKLLLDTGKTDADSKASGDYGAGRTPLSWAAENGYESVVILLLDWPGVDPGSKDMHGHTPFWWAAENGHERVIKLLYARDGTAIPSETGYVQRAVSKHVGTRERSATPRAHDETSATYVAPPKKIFGGRGKGFADLHSHLTSAYLAEEGPSLFDRHRMELSVEWEVQQAMPLYKKGTGFSSILVISGDEIDAQAATCESYLKEHFRTGLTVLHAVQAAWDSRTSYESDPAGGDLRHLSLSWQRAGEKRSCWHGLFKKAIIVLNGPISDRNQFGQLEENQTGLSVPKGLDIPFDIMVDLAAVDYPVEYARGIALRGFNTLLVVTAKWVTASGTAIQWHFVDSSGGISLSEYADNERYHIWKVGEEPPPQLETIREAIRTFIGWGDTYQIQLSAVNHSNVAVTGLDKASRKLVLKTIGFNTALGRSPVTAGVTATFEVQEGTVMHSRETEFHEMIARSNTTPVLLYAPDEERGWLVPQLSVLESMALINIGRYGSSDRLPPASLDLKDTRTRLLEHLRDPTLRRLLDDGDGDRAERNTFRLRELLYDLAQGLEWAEGQARHQHRWSPARLLGEDTIYGLEFYKLTMRDKEHHVKQCPVRRPHGGWVQLLNNGAIKGVLFCKGLGEVIVRDSTCPFCRNVPREHNYLAAVISCLEYLTQHDRLPSGFGWNFQSTAFAQCSNCSSFEHRIQNMNNASSPTTNPSTDHSNGVVVFGRPITNSRIQSTDGTISYAGHRAERW